MSETILKPQFLIVGAQKAGTTWLWAMLDQHPDTSLPKTKEIHFFGSSELYAKGKNWYYDHFQGLDASKLIGEASTTYLYDHVPFFYNKSSQIEYDDRLPLIPELIKEELGCVKIIITLRDPVARALSAYRHWLVRGTFSPLSSVENISLNKPKMRILEYGYYSQYIKAWMDCFPRENIKLLVFEEDIVKNPLNTMKEVYAFLGLGDSFSPSNVSQAVHKTFSFTRLTYNHYSKKYAPFLHFRRISKWFDNHDALKRFMVSEKDIEFLRSVYLPQKQETENLIGRSLDCWRYGR